MQKIGNLIQTMPAILPFVRTAEEQERFDQAYWEKCKQGDRVTYRPRKTLNQPWGKNAMPDFARFRLAVRFDNQKYAYYPSYDYNYALQGGKQIQIYDEQLGLEKLYTLANTEKKYWNWVAISIFVNITDKWADTQEKRYNYRLITWQRQKTSRNFLKLEWRDGRLDLDWMQMWVDQQNVKGYATAEELAPWDKAKGYAK